MTVIIDPVFNAGKDPQNLDDVLYNVELWIKNIEPMKGKTPGEDTYIGGIRTGLKEARTYIFTSKQDWEISHRDEKVEFYLLIKIRDYLYYRDAELFSSNTEREEGDDSDIGNAEAFRKVNDMVIRLIGKKAKI